MRFASSLRGLTATGFVLLALSGCGADNGVNPLPASGSTAGAGAGGTTTPPAGGGTGGTGGSGGTTTPPPDATSIVRSWYGIQANILQPFCVTCHQGAAQFAAGLSWEVGQYEAIVTNGRLSTEIATMLEVNPSNPDASYLMWKLRGQGPAGEPIVGVRMPATGVALDPALISVVQQWIANGAPLGDPADATAGGGTGTPSFPVGSWMHVWSNTLQVCTLCHSNTPSSDRCGVEFECPPKGVVLTSDNYAGVVDGDEVRPFRLDGSKLWERVIDPDPSKRMPFGMPPLTAEQLQIIEDWILDGAPFCPAGEPLDACTP